MVDVIVIALNAEGISAAFHATVIADHRSTIGAPGYGKLAARHTCVAVTGLLGAVRPLCTTCWDWSVLLSIWQVLASSSNKPCRSAPPLHRGQRQPITCTVLRHKSAHSIVKH